MVEPSTPCRPAHLQSSRAAPRGRISAPEARSWPETSPHRYCPRADRSLAGQLALAGDRPSRHGSLRRRTAMRGCRRNGRELHAAILKSRFTYGSLVKTFYSLVVFAPPSCRRKESKSCPIAWNACRILSCTTAMKAVSFALGINRWLSSCSAWSRFQGNDSFHPGQALMPSRSVKAPSRALPCSSSTIPASTSLLHHCSAANSLGIFPRVHFGLSRQKPKYLGRSQTIFASNFGPDPLTRNTRWGARCQPWQIGRASCRERV